MLIPVSKCSDADLVACFGHDGLANAKMLLMKTSSGALDDAFYGATHPATPGVIPDAAHQRVVSALHNTANAWPEYGDIAKGLADHYAATHLT